MPIKRNRGGLQIFDRGRPSDSTLTRVEMERGVKLEEHTAVLDRFLSETDGTYGWQGVLPRGGTLTVPKASIKDKISHADRVSRVRARLNRGEPPLLVTYDPATDTPIFAEEDQEAYEDGYICGGCLQYQSIPNAPECNWLRADMGSHIDPKDRGCGHRNY